MGRLPRGRASNPFNRVSAARDSSAASAVRLAQQIQHRRGAGTPRNP